MNENLDKINLISELVERMNKKDKEKFLVEDRNILKELANKENKIYLKQLTEKYKYLIENMNIFIKIKGNDDEKIEQFKNISYLFVGYCLVKQFIIFFNDEGKPKIRIFKGNQSFMFEHAALIGNILGKRSVDIEYYKRILIQIEAKIYKKCKTGEVEYENFCKNYVENLINDWAGYCSIERKKITFERPEEWALMHNKYIYEDGFSLADPSFMGINMLKMPGMVRQSREWAELYNDALDRFYMNKLTFTEAHHILVSVSKVLREKDFNIKIIEDALNKTTINYEINEELSELIKHPKNINQMEIVKERFSKLETNIQLRVHIQQCLLAVYLLKFTFANINLNLKDITEQQKFLEILENKLNGKSTENIETKFKEIEKKAAFLVKVFYNFTSLCDLNKNNNNKKGLEEMLETIKTSFLNFAKKFEYFCQLKVDKEILNLKDHFDNLFVVVDKFEYSLNKLVDELNLNRLIMEKFEMIDSNAHSLQQDGFHLATLEMIGIKIPKIPGITSEELEQFKKAFNIKQSNIEYQQQFNIQKSLEKCHQTLFAFSFIKSQISLDKTLSEKAPEEKAPEEALTMVSNRAYDCRNLNYLGTSHSLQQDGFHLATLEMIGIKIPKIPGITSQELEQLKKAFNIKQSNIEYQQQFNIQKSLEKCHQTLFAFSFIVSKYKKHQGNKWNIFNIKCLKCEENTSYFSDEEKNEINEFVKDLSKNVIEKCKFIFEWQNDLYRKSLDYTLNYEHIPKEDEHLKIKITDLNTQYINFVDVIPGNKPHGDATHQQSFSINNGEQSYKIIPDKNSHTNPQSIPLLNQHEVVVNNLFENLDDITAKAKEFKTKLDDIKKYMGKNKSLKNELYQNNFADIIEEKMEFLLKNWEKIFEDISGDKEDDINLLGIAFPNDFLKHLTKTEELTLKHS
uniref:Uncharacterized protein n=1 Tax=Meloidogyne floridensis TaxID=298350 RepID=A0A915PFH6_9BILA